MKTENILELEETRERLSDLIAYVGHMMKFGQKSVFKLEEYQQTVFHEVDLKNRIGITHNTFDNNGPIWIRIERLKRIDPPVPPEEIKSWVTVNRDPFSTPKVQAHRTETISGQKAKSLLQKGILLASDIQPALKTEKDGIQCDVIFRLKNLPHVQSAVDAYCNGLWLQWAEEEKLRRESITIYETLFSLQQNIETQGPEKPLELVWGMGLARWRVRADVVINHPLVEQLVEIEINSEDGTINVRPRGTAPGVHLKPFFELEIPGAQTVFDYSRKFFENFTEDQEFSPFVESLFTPVLRHAATNLDRSGEYYPDSIEVVANRSLPSLRENLTVTDTWTIYARRRSDNFIINDLEQLKKAVQDAEELPSPLLRLVCEPSSTPIHQGSGVDSCLGNLRSQLASKNDSCMPDPMAVNQLGDFFFPKPYNDEQIMIGRRLEEADGAVVQGPPGTGKTHTIANIICHYLATGRRVLVTSKGEAALTVLRDHIPEDIRDLTISLLTSEREGLEQLEKAVSILSNTATSKYQPDLERQIIDTQDHILDLNTQIAAIDSELQQWAEKHLKPIVVKGNANGILPMDLAKRVLDDRKRHEWFPRPESDKLLKPKPLLTEEDIREIRQARTKLGRDLVYVHQKLPSSSDLPDQETVTAIHQDLLDAHSLEQEAVKQNIPVMTFAIPKAGERAQKLLEAIRLILAFFQQTESRPWLIRLCEIWRKNGGESEETKLFDDLIPLMASIVEQRLQTIGNAVEIPEETVYNVMIYDAVARSASGKRPFGLISIGKSAEKALFEAIRIEGRPPESKAEWEKVLHYLKWRRELNAFCGRWRVIAPDFGLCELKDVGNQTGLWVLDTLRIAEQGKHIVTNLFKEISLEISDLFPGRMEPLKIVASAEGAITAAQIIDFNLSKNRLLKCQAMINQVMGVLSPCSGDVVDQIRKFFKEKIGNPKYSHRDIATYWQELSADLNRLHNLTPQMETVRRVGKAVRESGAQKWAEALTHQVVDSEVDPLTPQHWRESWTWIIQDAYLKKIDGQGRIRGLSDKRLAFDKDLKNAFEKVVQLRTYLGLKHNMTDRVESALVMFTAAIRRIGKGTGIRAQRFRKDARKAMEDSYTAIPCWIMPSWRVSESLPPQLGVFDLVIVDEASQSDIMALPALMRGKKLLIVGDDKQVSPTAAFIEERKLLQLRHQFLSDQPFAPLLLPGTSLYDLANAIFPGRRIMLREHFRCVEPIIRFSMQFYSEDIIPLRIPKASERLNPPLIDVYVPHGQKTKSQINPAEAEAIVDEIVRIVDDPDMENRSIGVVSLIGAKQAQYIQTLLLSKIGEEQFLRHKIACGDSATFQGKERDIMFVSMVECPRSKSAKTGLMFQQRFNVALSRARDRMYLFRSVTEEMLKPEDLKARIILHFKSPMGAVSTIKEDLKDRCESDFERDVFSRLVRLGYRVTPQVSVGSYSIDMVVEGIEDRRLAIELDGDRYHTPDRWADDYRRQQILERVGWRFWRCWGSTYILDPERCLKGLIQTLKELGIEPLAREVDASNVYTEHRVIESEVIKAYEIQKIEDYAIESIPKQMELFEQKKPMDSENGQKLKGIDSPVSALDKSSIQKNIHQEELFVEVGDRVLISYNDEPTLQHTIRISETEHDPEMKIIRKDKPLAQALLNAGVHEEVEIPAGGKTRIVMVIDIEKGQHERKVIEKKEAPLNVNYDANEEKDCFSAEKINLNPLSPGDLSHTKIIQCRVDAVEVKNWNRLAETVHKIAIEKIGSFEKLAEITKANIVTGIRNDRGYRPVPEAGFSIQGESANKVWDDALHLSRAIGILLEVVIEWRDNPRAAHPNKKGILSWKL